MDNGQGYRILAPVTRVQIALPFLSKKESASCPKKDKWAGEEVPVGAFLCS
jgi:hypothetical protein